MEEISSKAILAIEETLNSTDLAKTGESLRQRLTTQLSQEPAADENGYHSCIVRHSFE